MYKGLKLKIYSSDLVNFFCFVQSLIYSDYMLIDGQAKVQTAQRSSLSPSGGHPNPYWLFFETSLLISPQDQSGHK